LPVDDVHPDVLGQKIHDRLAIRNPEGDVIQGLGPHVASVPTGYRSTESSHFLISLASARCLFTVAAAICFARFVERPCFFSDSLMCDWMTGVPYPLS